MAYLNPVYYKGPLPQKAKNVPAVDGHTWQGGQWAWRSDSGVVPCKANATAIHCILAKTQATATSSSKVEILTIPSSQTQFQMAVTSGGTDTKADPAFVGYNKGLGVNSCICSVSVGNDTTGVIHIDDQYALKEAFKNDTGDVPGYYIVSIPDAVLNAEGVGVA